MAEKRNSSKKATSTSRKGKQQEEQERTESFRTEVILWIIIAVSLVLFISNFGVGGKIGNAVSSFFFGLFGLAAYVFPILLVVGSFFIVSNKGNRFAVLKLAAVLLFVAALCLFMSMVVNGDSAAKPIDAYKFSSENRFGGGLVGGSLAYLLTPAFGRLGTYIIDIIVMIVMLVLITERSALKGMKKGGRKVYETAKETNVRHREERARRRMDNKVSGVSTDTKIERAAGSKKSDEISELHPDDIFDMPEIKEQKKTKLASGEQEEILPQFPPEPKNAAQPVILGTYVKEEPESVSEVKPEPPKKKTKVSAQELERGVAEVAEAIAENETITHYMYPPVTLLKEGNKKARGNTEKQLRETAQKLEQTLKTFGVSVTVTNISCGPSVTRYEVQPEMGVKVSKIVNLADDLKLNLAAADIRIEAPIPGKAAVGIEVPNPENVTVSFRDLIESEEFETAKSKVSFAVGKDISGKIKVADIAKMPHLLIAGATGSGKSVCINTIIMSILYKAKPDEVKLIMIDPKVVELSVYNGIPHLMIPVVTDPKKAAGALNWAVAEMTERYQKFAEANVREMNGYNEKISRITVPEGEEPPKKLPQIVIIVDELADLMMVASNDVEEAICRLAQLARAAGIHLVIATQRPSVNVITGLIKANMPSRIAFAVTSGTDSRTILDMVGAEKLLGKGDMLFHPQGISKPIRVQGAFISDQEVAEVVNFLTDHNGKAQYSSDVQEKMNQMESVSSGASVTISDMTEEDGRDSYFVEAAQIIVDKEKASIGMLQRYLKVGFNRAARIMDQLEEAGVVGPEEGTKPRKVLMTTEEFQQYVDENL